MATPRDRGWGWPGAPGSAEERRYRQNITTIEVAGIRLAVRKEVAPIFVGFIKDMVTAGYRFDEVRDDWGWANRDIRGRPGVKSNHAWGLAVDLNATRNPMGSRRTEFDRQEVTDLAKRWGLTWGLDWSRPDPMHFEFIDTPQDAQRVITRNLSSSIPPIEELEAMAAFHMWNRDINGQYVTDWVTKWHIPDGAVLSEIKARLPSVEIPLNVVEAIPFHDGRRGQ